MKRICVFCGSSSGKSKEFMEAATLLGQELVSHNIGLVYGGSNVGLMGRIADSVLEGGGEAVGVIPHSLVSKEVAHTGLSELRVVNSMHERKAAMVDLADGFIALPGGLGTLEELFEVMTWAQLGFHQKPCAMLNVNGYYDSLIAFLDHAVAQQFVKDIHRSMLIVEEQPADLLQRMLDYQPPLVDKWIGRNET